MDRNPCLGCDLRDEDKNGRRCMECDDRVEYVSGLVGRTHASPACACTHADRPKGYAGQGGNKMTILEEKVEEIIKEVCDEFGVEVSKLREGKHFKKYSQARTRIAERLIADYGMSKQKIGELAGVSNQAIYYLLKKKKKTTDAVDILHKRYIGDDPERKASLQAERHPSSPSASPRQGKTEPKPERTVTIDFSGRTELFKHLGKYAKEEIRSVEDQIMYFIQNQLSFEEAYTDGNQG